MHMRVGLRDGRVLNSKSMSQDEWTQEIELNDGLLGYGDLEKVKVENVEDLKAFLNNVWNILVAEGEGELEISVEDGTQVKFEAGNVGWFRWADD